LLNPKQMAQAGGAALITNSWVETYSEMRHSKGGNVNILYLTGNVKRASGSNLALGGYGGTTATNAFWQGK
jgi:hypothetical protein